MMKILSLGHSSYILEMTPAAGEPVRILADPWLSDYLIGDLMGRFPRVRLDLQALQPIHAIYLSHSHTDHLDPYALLELRKLDPCPILLLPQSMEYLQPLLQEYLPELEITLLRQGEETNLQGLKLTAMFNPELRATNEDDVMVLIAETGEEVFVGEGDALMPLYDSAAREELADRLNRQGVQTSCFLTVKNEGDSTMNMLSAKNGEQRKELLGQSIEATYAELYDIYSPLDEDTDSLWANPALVRVITGQGICYPQALDADYNRILFPIRLEDRARMEREVAGQFDCQHSIEELVPGHLHELAGGKQQSSTPALGVTILDQEAERHFDPGSKLERNFPEGPLLEDQRDIQEQKRRIAECLQLRFLPWLIGARTPPLEHLLADGKGEYRIRIRYGTSSDHEETDHLLSFARLSFQPIETAGKPDEFYWANDIDDVLAGRADEFSLCCREPLEGKAQRLWRCLGLPYLNNDLIEKKLRLHFERAARGETPDSWAEPYWQPRENLPAD
ncbi:MAG: MBL fold metallo-hydrolase [Planctomycetota bacterium]|nr:MBL fold metallo-hydrolase [Planctomycetota bacterium]